MGALIPARPVRASTSQVLPAFWFPLTGPGPGRITRPGGDLLGPGTAGEEPGASALRARGKDRDRERKRKRERNRGAKTRATSTLGLANQTHVFESGMCFSRERLGPEK